MNLKKVSPRFFISDQLSVTDIGIAAAQGIRTIVNNRPDGEEQTQPTSDELREAAESLGLGFVDLPIKPGKITDEHIEKFEALSRDTPAPMLSFCRSGARAMSLWALAEARTLNVDVVLATAEEAGHDLESLRDRLVARAAAGVSIPKAEAEPSRAKSYDVVVVGGGTGGISTAMGLLRRRSDLDILIVEPRDAHYYQPGWTLVGGGVFDRAKTQRKMADVMPEGVDWKRAAVAEFEPERNSVLLEDGERIQYRALVTATGIKLDWDAIEGLRDTLGKNGVTSNYLYDMAPYTWQLVQDMRKGRALFTQPPMPIKCAGAPQKAMYLSCDHWLQNGRLKDIDVEFHNAGGVLFGVAEYVPALMSYIEKYDAKLCLNENLVAVDGPAKKAWFDRTKEDGEKERIEAEFDMMHVCPVQTAPDVIRNSDLANDGGWVDVSAETLQHTRYGNIFAVGDVASAPNAKTAAAIRKQAPVVADNVIGVLDGMAPHAVYDGYGSCPLTVERGKIVLAEFGYGGKHLPTFPQWIINSFEPSRLAWLLKEKMLPAIYWDLLLKGREWLVDVERLPQVPAAHEPSPAYETATK